MSTEQNQKSSVIRVGDVSSRPGTKQSGRLKVAEKAASSIELPLTIIQGQIPGPTLVVLAGEHGCESLRDFCGGPRDKGCPARKYQGNNRCFASG